MKEKTGSRGVVYIATGSKFVSEALASIGSLKKQMPDLPVTLFTDSDDRNNFHYNKVDSVFLIDEATRSCRDKIRPLLDSPYEKTLFLDTDTFYL